MALAADPRELGAVGRVPPRRTVLLSSGVLATSMFIIVEVMLFGGFISAFNISKAGYLPGTWPPPDQPRLPVEATAFTTLLLLVSGAVLWWSGRRRAQGDAVGAGRALLVALALGTLFIGVQGVEWARLIAQGLTLSSSAYGSFFYVIVGAHALHAIPALGFLALSWARMRSGRLTDDGFTSVRLFWYFVVLVWPVLYWKVYL